MNCVNVSETRGAQWELLFRILLSTDWRGKKKTNLPAAGKFKPFAPAAPSKPAEETLLRFSRPQVL